MLASAKRKEVARGERIVNNRMGLDGEVIVIVLVDTILVDGVGGRAGRAAAVI